MVGRQGQLAATSGGSSITNNDQNESSIPRSRVQHDEEQEEEAVNGARKEKGLNQPPRQGINDGSDGDELGDSDSERSGVDSVTKRKLARLSSTSILKPSKSRRSRGRPSNKAKAALSAATSTNTTVPETWSPSLAEGRTRSPGLSEKLFLSRYPWPTESPTSPLHSSDRPSAITKSSSSKMSRNAHAPVHQYPQEITKATAESSSSNSSSAPYYYNNNNKPSSTAPSTRPKHSAQDIETKNRMPPFTTMTGTTGYKADTAPPVNTPSSSSSNNNNAENLSRHEVDKFLDLIEKHNLHTSNEDDMARSVTELYQEWLEWCAKRSVQSTKSKQALVAEFVRIHQGEYGRDRQKRAMEIVKGSAEGIQDGDRQSVTNNIVTSQQSSSTYMPSSKSAPSNTTASRHKDEDREGYTSTASTGGKRTSTGGAYIHVPSPSIAPRALTPGPSLSNLETINSQSESLYRRVREDVWRDASIMIEKLVQEQTSVLLEKNNLLRGRVEQLEVHSDNLAQWIQHLNRVQDELNLSFQAPPLREEVVTMQDPSTKYSRHNTEQERTFTSTYHPATHSSPKQRSYAVRKSPSPPILTHHPTFPIDTRRLPIGDRSRDSRDFHSTGNIQGSHNAASARVASLSDHYDRSYYGYPPLDDSNRSPHLGKRARNGY